MNTLPWFHDQLSQWTQLVDKNKVPHALLISGGKGLGKMQLAHEMANIALCENLTLEGVCHKCVACHLVNAGNHTDLTIISAEKSFIKVEQIRQLSRTVILSGTRNQYKVVLIQDAEKMNKAAANALLKTLEEPPAKVIILLTTSEIGRLLATIKSRCVKQNISSPLHQMAVTWLNSKYNKNKEDINLSLILCNDAPMSALELLQRESLPIIKTMMSDLIQISTDKKSILEVSKIWIGNEWLVYLSNVSAYLLAILKQHNSFNSLQMQDDIKQKFSFINDKNEVLLKFIHEIHLFNKRNETALKSELLLEELLIKWKNF